MLVVLVGLDGDAGQGGVGGDIVGLPQIAVACGEPALEQLLNYMAAELPCLVEKYGDEERMKKAQSMAVHYAEKETDRATFQAMEAFIHNLNTMHSRAGAQTPFSSINYGMDTSPEGRMVMRNLMLTTEQGLGNGATPIFPGRGSCTHASGPGSQTARSAGLRTGPASGPARQRRRPDPPWI